MIIAATCDTAKGRGVGIRGCAGGNVSGRVGDGKRTARGKV